MIGVVLRLPDVTELTSATCRASATVADEEQESISLRREMKGREESAINTEFALGHRVEPD